MQLSIESPGWVTISYTEPATGERVTRTFRAPAGREGYVWENTHRCQQQVCEELAGTGTTLIASAETLPAVIRREYRRMRRAWARAEGMPA